MSGSSGSDDKLKGKIPEYGSWQQAKEPRKPRFYVQGEPPPRTEEQTAIERWLELADKVLGKDDTDPSSSAA